MSPDELIGVAFILFAFALFVLEVKAPGFGLLGAGGVLSLVAGLLLVFGLSWATVPVLVAVVLPLAVLVAFMAVLAHRAQRSKVITGEGGMIGLEGRAETDLLPEGKVSVRGELWDASSTVRLARGAPVRVTGVRGLRLEVAAVSHDRHLQSPVSAVICDGDLDREKAG